MAQAPQGVLDRIFAKFQSKKSGTQQQTAREIDDPASPGKKIPNPAWKEPAQTQNDDPTSMFAGLFNQQDQGQGKQAPKFTLSREKIAEAAGKMNFMEGLPKELTEAMSADGGMTMENISALVNHAGRTAYSKALEHNTSLTGHFVDARMAHEQSQLPDHIRTHMGKRRAVPAGMDNPVVKEHMEFVAGRIAERFPDANEDDIAEMSQEFFTTMAKSINPGAFQQQDGQQRNSRDDSSDVQDFDSYLQGTKTLDQAKTTPAAPAKSA